MILALDTSTPVCRTWLIDEEGRRLDEWDVGRGLADGLIGHLRALLGEHTYRWSDITAIAVFKGPGSFTGLRIGLTVMNTLADTQSLPIVGEAGEDWLEKALERIAAGQSDGLVMPLYGREANITKPRK